MDDQLRTIFMDVFGISDDQYSDDLSTDDVENWDSVAHITLILTLEAAFGVRFTPSEAYRLQSVRLIKCALSER